MAVKVQEKINSFEERLSRWQYSTESGKVPRNHAAMFRHRSKHILLGQQGSAKAHRHYMIATSLWVGEMVQHFHWLEAAISSETGLCKQELYRNYWGHWKALRDILGSWNGFVWATKFPSSCLIHCLRDMSTEIRFFDRESPSPVCRYQNRVCAEVPSLVEAWQVEGLWK